MKKEEVVFRVGDPVVFAQSQLNIDGNIQWLKEYKIDPHGLYTIGYISRSHSSFGGYTVRIKELPTHNSWGSGWFELAKNKVVFDILNDL